MPAAKAEPARDPAPPRVPAPDPAVLVVETAAVPVHQPTVGDGDELAQRRHPVLQRHFQTVDATKLPSGSLAAGEVMKPTPREVKRRMCP